MSLRHLTRSTRNFGDLALIAQGYSNHNFGKKKVNAEFPREVMKFPIELADATYLSPWDGTMGQNW